MKISIKNSLTYLFQKKLFGLIIIGVGLLGLGSWFYSTKSNESNMQYRLERELNHVTTSLNSNIFNYANTLGYLQAYFRTEGVPEPATFKRLALSIESQHTNHAMQGIGYISIVRETELADYIKTHSPWIQSNLELLKPGKKIYAPLTMAEPLTEARAKLIGWDMLTEETRRESIFAAIHSAQLTMSKPIDMSMVLRGSRLQAAVLLTLADFRSLEIPPTPEQRLNEVRGVLYIPLLMSDFFEAIMGPPVREKERVNFTVSAIDPKTQVESILYKRFEEPPHERSLTQSRLINVYGATWKVTMTTFPQFFNFGDRYIANIVAISFLLLIILLYSLFLQTQSLLSHEKRTSELFRKVEDSNKMKTAFLSNMSHEIRTPLNAIIGYSEILEQTASPEEKHTLIENIKKNTSQLTSIIDNILDISKIEFGRILVNKKIISLTALVGSLETDMKARADAKGLNFKVESLGKVPAYIETDESRVKQILINLIGNAIKFTEQGSVKLQISCDTTLAQTYLYFNIIDTGIGIEATAQEELFQSFTQVEKSHTRRFGGIGLGLALSKRLAQQFGGDVSLVQSDLQEGSVFQLKIPCGDAVSIKWLPVLKPEAASTVSPSQLIKNQLKDKKILIVEDSLDNQEIFNYFLTSAGALTELVDNGEDAVKKAESFIYDLILMDIQLPKMDGLEATRRIRASGYAAPIVALTAHASSEEKISCLNAGCIDLITKPVTQTSLIKRVHDILEEENHV